MQLVFCYYENKLQTFLKSQQIKGFIRKCHPLTIGLQFRFTEVNSHTCTQICTRALLCVYM